MLVNDLTGADMLATLLKYDSTHRRFDGTVKAEGNNLVVNSKTIRIASEKDPGQIPCATARWTSFSNRPAF